MSKIVRFFFFFYIFHTILSVRPDLDNSLRRTEENIYIGDTCTGTFDSSNVVYCADNTWAYGFKLAYYKTSSVDYGVLNIVLDCRGQTYDATNQVWSTTTSQIAQYSNMGYFGGLALKYTSFVYCNGDNGRDFIRGSNLRMWCPFTLIENPQGICEVHMNCWIGDELVSDLATTHAASWTGYSLCMMGTVVCGYTMNYKSTIGTSFGAIDIQLECCIICDVLNGFYFTAENICEHCDINCAECFGTATFCTKCFTGFTLSSSNTCTTTLL